MKYKGGSMEKKIAEAIKEAMDQRGENCRIHENYSGRGMHGQTTTAIAVGYMAGVLEAVIEHADILVASEIDRVDTIHMDQLGRDIILYQVNIMKKKIIVELFDNEYFIKLPYKKNTGDLQCNKLTNAMRYLGIVIDNEEDEFIIKSSTEIENKCYGKGIRIEFISTK